MDIKIRFEVVQAKEAVVAVSDGADPGMCLAEARSWAAHYAREAGGQVIRGTVQYELTGADGVVRFGGSTA